MGSPGRHGGLPKAGVACASTVVLGLTLWAAPAVLAVAPRAREGSGGAQVWVDRYAGPHGAYDQVAGMGVSPDGSRVYVAGFGRPSIGVPHGYRVVAYRAATGTQLSVGRYADGGDDFAEDMAISGDGSRVFMTGANAQDFITVAFRASLGQPLWAERYDGGHGVDHANSVAVSEDGDQVFVTGLSERGRVACFSGIRSTSNTTIQYDAATGSRGWVARYVGLKRSPDEGIEAVGSPDGPLVFVTGNSDSECRSSDVATLAYQTS